MELTPEQKKRVIERFNRATDLLEEIYRTQGIMGVHEYVSSLVGAYMVMVYRYQGFKGAEIAAQNLELIIDGGRRGIGK